eukprot:NODE_1611_length_1441_cov_22.643075_g1528_i0.p1 GENE.NODE_1611_length_1441_cov_22.643075_g1528_i0~~NODE_1611_length_1441_cov_22.643075_g1528_i0.p1  ORF type:complete len:445 (-),score=104.06 NODE_1611_length_1441_cov_22.643075_g1528_i0:105-1367(-)
MSKPNSPTSPVPAGCCILCFESFLHLLPHVLECGHSMCMDCIRTLTVDEGITCPCCSGRTDGSAESLPVNHALRNLVEQLSTSLNSAPRNLSQMHSSHASSSPCPESFAFSPNSSQLHSPPSSPNQLSFRSNITTIPAHDIKLSPASPPQPVNPSLCPSQCQSCFGDFGDCCIPRLLCCFHTYCECCLVALQVDNCLQCPKCGDTTVLGPAGVPSLLRNYALEAVHITNLSAMMGNNISELVEFQGAACPVCLDGFWRITPKLLRCGHTICSQCVVNLCKELKCLLRCPTCRHCTFFGPLGYQVLPTNHSLLELIHQWSAVLGERPPTAPQWLTATNEEAFTEAKWVFFGDPDEQGRSRMPQPSEMSSYLLPSRSSPLLRLRRRPEAEDAGCTNLIIFALSFGMFIFLVMLLSYFLVKRR